MSHRPSLSFGASPRASPFRRPESPASPSPLRQSTSNTQFTRPASNSISTPHRLAKDGASSAFPPKMRDPLADADGNNSSPALTEIAPGSTRSSAMAENNALSKLQAVQVRELREGFQTLDRDSDGVVVREDVADMFTQLGLSVSSSELASFFPPGAPQNLTLPTYMNSIATLLASLSPPTELLSAFSAFDEDENGQADLSELRNSLLHTAPEPGEKALSERDIDKVLNAFTSKRAFGKQSSLGMAKRGDVFKYQEFVAGISGGPDTGRGDRSSEA